MKIKNKLITVFVGLASVTAVVGFLAIKSLNEIKTDMMQINRSSLLELQSSTEMAFELIAIDGLFKQYIHKAIENNGSEVAIQKTKIKKSFIAFEKALNTRKTITYSGMKFYQSEELEDENQELKTMVSLENKYRLYKKSILECMTEYEKSASVINYKFHEDKWKNEADIFISELKDFKNGAENEIATSTEDVVKKAGRSTNYMIIIATISFFLGIISCIYLSKSIVSPILKLNAAARNIASGNMDAVANVKTSGEIRDLVISFNQMAMDLKTGRRQIEEYNKTLEQKVNQRTAELEASIDKLKQTEKKLKTYANNLQTSNLELEQFAYVASHDLQEPLRTTISFVSMFRQQYFGKIDAKADKYINYIVQASDRMGVLIKDLLDFSRIGHNKDIELVDCNLVLHDVVADIDKAIKDADAEINGEHLPVINGYATELKQLFQNLLLNSIKFRKKSIPLQISIAARQSGEYWQFAFTDNGIGLDQEHSERIFIIFQRLHNRTEYQGSGIGLSHCKKIVELHHGKIWVQSAPGQGSTFYFTIHSPTDEINESKTQLEMADNKVANPYNTSTMN